MKTGVELIHEMNTCVLAQGEMAFWWLGQLGYAVKIGETIIYIDAYLSENDDRTIAPLLKPEEVTNADFFFGTHDHEDHIDRGVWGQLSISSPNAQFIVSELIRSRLSAELNIPEDRFIGLDHLTSMEIGDLKITGIASAHEFLDQDKETGIYPYLGYIIEGNGCSFYHSGDTCIYPELLPVLKKWKPFHVIFVPINGRDAIRYESGCIGNMTYQEAVDLVGNLKPILAVPGHYEMFSSNSENPWLFANYLRVKYPDVNCWIGSHGDKVTISNK